MAQSQRDEENRTECIVAAILTLSVIGATGSGSTPEWVVRRYAETLQQLRAKGGHMNPIGALP